ncbi:protein aurora borealis-like [Haemaphysalis longicornis]
MTDFRQSFARGASELDSPVSSRSHAKTLQSTPGRGRSGMGDSTGNPFDVEPEQLTQPSFSPSVFVSRSRRTPGSGRSFRWSIEQMADLWPANIDEHEPSLAQPARSDALYEEQSQQAIEVFFSRHEIVPSPWEPHARLSIRPPGMSNTPQSPREPETSTAWSQTTLSIPPDADLSALLGDYYTFHGPQDKQQARPNAANTSLRRKLFCTAVEGRARTPERRDSEQRLSLFLDGATGSLTPIHRALCSSPIGPTRCSQGSSPEGEGGMQLSPICRHARPIARSDTPQQKNLRLPDSPVSAGDRTEEESLTTSGGDGSDASVLTAPDCSEAMLVSPNASTHSPL